MRPLQKMAWYNLAVISIAVAVFLVSIPLAGVNAASGGLTGVLVPIAFGVIFFMRRKKGEALGRAR